MHKIFARATLRTSARSSFPRPLYAARFSNRRAEDATALCYQRVSLPSPLAPVPAAHGETFSPRAICRRQCALPRDSRRLQDFARPVCLFSLIALPFLNAELSPSALPPVPPCPPPRPRLVPRRRRFPAPSSFISSFILARCFLRSPFLPCNHIHPGEYRAPSFTGEPSLLARERYDI